MKNTLTVTKSKPKWGDLKKDMPANDSHGMYVYTKIFETLNYVRQLRSLDGVSNEIHDI